MRFGFRLRLGPFVAYQRLGRTQAQKRAAAKARTGRLEAREARLRTGTDTGTVVNCAAGRLEILPNGNRTVTVSFRTRERFEPGQKVSYTYRPSDRKLISVTPSGPASGTSRGPV